MQTRKLGHTDIDITCIGLGTNYVGGHGLYTDIDEDEGVRLVQRALDLGITFIPWGPLAFGVLGGRYQRDFVLPADDWRHRSGTFDAGSFSRSLDTVEQLKQALDVACRGL